MKVSVSFLKRNEDLPKTLKKIDQTDADFIHVDIMDGDFVEEKTEGIKEIFEELKNVSKPLDIHLMVSDPLHYFPMLKSLKVEYLTFHEEITENPYEIINAIKACNIKVGISIKPQTAVETIMKYLPDMDQVLVMSVNPGQGGQKFLPEVLSKVEFLKEWKHENKSSLLISIDGGINEETAKLAKTSGVDMTVSGSYVCLEKDFQNQITKLR